MQGINRPTELLGVSIFIAPANRPIRPVEIAPGTEIVEVMIGGRIFFEQEGTVREYERGTIFWHTAGDTRSSERRRTIRTAVSPSASGSRRIAGRCRG